MAWPDYPHTETEYRRWDQDRDARLDQVRLVAEVDESIIGVGSLSHLSESFHPNRYEAEIAVDPAFLRQGVGTALFHALRSERPQALALLSGCREGAVGVSFLEALGFDRTLREPVSELDVQAFDAGRYDYLLRRVGARYRLCSRAALQSRQSGVLRRVHALHNAVLADIPLGAPATAVPFEEYETERTYPGYDAAGCILCLSGDRLVGISELLSAEAEPGLLSVTMTGVLPNHRHRGIATAMKVLGIRWAQTAGATLIRTDNEENNPMYGLNLSLGFVPRPAWLTYARGESA